jgi:hypothetical protein
VLYANKVKIVLKYFYFYGNNKIRYMLNKFLKTGLAIFCVVLLFSFTIDKMPGEAIKGDYQQALRGFEYLKKVRKDPNAYTERLRVSLKDIPAGPELRWNDTLAMVAEERALDMAQKDYYGHIDKEGYGANYYINKAGFRLDDEFLKHKRGDDFEAVIAGSYQSGEEAIGAMITDRDESDAASRKLLLAMTDFSKGLTEIGIGFVHGTKETKYRYYTVVIITKRRK